MIKTNIREHDKYWIVVSPEEYKVLEKIKTDADKKLKEIKDNGYELQK